MVLSAQVHGSAHSAAAFTAHLTCDQRSRVPAGGQQSARLALGSQARSITSQPRLPRRNDAAARTRTLADSIDEAQLVMEQTVQPALRKAKSARSSLISEAQVLWARYQRALDRQPVQAKALTSFVGLLVADCIAQAAEPGAYDAMRTARMATFGLCWHGLSGHYWYQLLDRFVMPKQPQASVTIVTKMMLDQLIWAPLNTAIFYASLALMQGDPGSIAGTLDAKLIPTVLAGYLIWPMAHLVNFKFIPEKNRLLYINVVNLFWSIYLAHMANSASTGFHIDVPKPQLPITPIPVSHPAPPPPPPGIHTV